MPTATAHPSPPLAALAGEALLRQARVDAAWVVDLSAAWTFRTWVSRRASPSDVPIATLMELASWPDTSSLDRLRADAAALGEIAVTHPSYDHATSLWGALGDWLDNAVDATAIDGQHRYVQPEAVLARATSLDVAANLYFARSVQSLAVVVRTQRRDRELGDSLRALLERCGSLAGPDDADLAPPRERGEPRVALPDAPLRALPRETRAGPPSGANTEVPGASDDGEHPPREARP